MQSKIFTSLPLSSCLATLSIRSIPTSSCSKDCLGKVKARDAAGVLEKYVDESSSITKRTPLHAAAHNGFVQTVKELLSMGASTEAKDYLGKTALDLARNRGFDQVVNLLE
mmetsp:Transcript_9532/g.10618  ORF Transcript_9532/g.10618 Transcript_9532/m.10618 type:complete len:111 (-) Transcript_9532:1-333(-)